MLYSCDGRVVKALDLKSNGIFPPKMRAKLPFINSIKSYNYCVTKVEDVNISNKIASVLA
ncbi:hypothetical protein T4B_12258 [Trichinella pseudospiralis]|uniref:Uncharacterized protein n=2 Tax=Trichinella pseudospiralis TaxID=6337 RepID=A0A0V1FDC4_TRIPS|nr:hypothetical protein T4D_7278 [Trichinella pseudospiralis]KRZ32404.1 hypothetical protein T4B_12258 [Trichinella pseudospiralis]